MKKIKIAYSIYLLTVLAICILCMTNMVDKNVVMIGDVLLVAIIFLFCCNIFYVPRNMDHGIFLENKQKMKSDPILWKEMLFLETPLIIVLLMIVFMK